MNAKSIESRIRPLFDPVVDQASILDGYIRAEDMESPLFVETLFTRISQIPDNTKDTKGQTIEQLVRSGILLSKISPYIWKYSPIDKAKLAIGGNLQPKYNKQKLASVVAGVFLTADAHIMLTPYPDPDCNLRHTEKFLLSVRGSNPHLITEPDDIRRIMDPHKAMIPSCADKLCNLLFPPQKSVNDDIFLQDTVIFRNSE